MNKTLLIMMALALSASVLGKEKLSQKIVLRANKDHYGLAIQQALTLDLKSKGFEGTRNSNFICGPERSVYLGTIKDKFSSQDQIYAGHFQSMEYELKVKDPNVAVLKKEVSKKYTVRPHAIKTYLNKESINREKETDRILKYMSFNCERFINSKLFENGLRISIKTIKNESTRKVHYELYEELVKDGEISKPKLRPFQEYGCKKNNQYFECKIPGKGVALLKG